MTESVECQTCGDTRLVNDEHDVEYIDCPDCTPENVECPRCNGTNRTSCDWPDKCWEHASWSCAPCDHPTPENVECQTCDGKGWDWKRVADDGLLPDDPVDEYPCPDCTPENVETPDAILDSSHLSQRQKEDALVAWLFAKVGKPPTPENVEELT